MNINSINTFKINSLYCFKGKKHKDVKQTSYYDKFFQQDELYTKQQRISKLSSKDIFLEQKLSERLSDKTPARRLIENSKASTILGDKNLQARFRNCDITNIGNFNSVIWDISSNKTKHINATNQVILYAGKDGLNSNVKINNIDSDEVIIYDSDTTNAEIDSIRTKMFNSKCGTSKSEPKKIHIKNLEITDGFINPSYNYQNYEHGAVYIEGLQVDKLKSKTLNTNNSIIKEADVTGDKSYCLIRNSQIDTLKTSNIESLINSHIKKLIIPEGTKNINIPLGKNSIIDKIICEDPNGCVVKVYRDNVYQGLNIKIDNGEIQLFF